MDPRPRSWYIQTCHRSGGSGGGAVGTVFPPEKVAVSRINKNGAPFPVGGAPFWDFCEGKGGRRPNRPKDDFGGFRPPARRRRAVCGRIPWLAGSRAARRAGAAARRRRGRPAAAPKNRPKGGLPCGPLPVPAQMCEGDCRKTDRPCGVRPFPPAWPRCGGGGCTWRCARCGRGRRF